MSTVVENNNFEQNIEELLQGKKHTVEEINERINYIKTHYPDVKILRVCSYGRVSTKHEEQESSLYTQNILFHEYCERKLKEGYVLVEEIYDRKSATLASKRPKFLDMIERAKAGEFDILLFKDIKRFSRNISETLDIVEDLQRQEIYIDFINENASSKTMDREHLTVHAMISESHSNGLHKSVSVAKRINAEREEGRVPSYVFGYDKPTINDSRILHINEYEAGLVKEMFIRLRGRETFGSICDDWRSRGVKSKLGNNISTAALRRMARLTIYKGVIENCKTEKNDVRDKRKEVPVERRTYRVREDLRIVDDELFDDVQKIMDDRKFGEDHMRNIPRKRILSGIIQCDCCGKHFKRYHNGVGDKKATYFKCSTKKQHRRNAEVIECDNNTMYREDEIMLCLSLYIEELIKNHDNIRELILKKAISISKEMKKSADKNAVSIEDVNAMKKKFERAKMLFVEGDITKADYDKIKADLLDLERRYGISNFVNIDTEELGHKVDNWVENLRLFIQKGLSSDMIDGDKFNNLLDSIISETETGKLIINFQLDGKHISPLVYTNGNRSNAKGLCKIGSLGSTSSSKCTVKCLVPLNNLIDWNRVHNELDSMRDLNTANRRKYRYSVRCKSLGVSWFDEINIVL